MEIEKLNLIGAFTAVSILLLGTGIFVLRLMDKPGVEFWIGLVFILAAIPISFLLIKANQFDRPVIYVIQLSIMLSFIILELLLDYILKINFRTTQWAVILYVTLFFAATGGMIGVASYAGRSWMLTAIILFLIMAILAFIQRAKTGL